MSAVKNLSWSVRVAQLRERRGWTQEDLALRLRITRQAVSQIETGVSEPSGPTQLLIEQLIEQLED